nr:MAG TPA: hypothetical protein [Caudoviricetes sp.]
MELFKLLGTIAIENGEANNAIDNTTDRVKKSESIGTIQTVRNNSYRKW